MQIVSINPEAAVKAELQRQCNVAFAQMATGLLLFLTGDGDLEIEAVEEVARLYRRHQAEIADPNGVCFLIPDLSEKPTHDPNAATNTTIRGSLRMVAAIFTYFAGGGHLIEEALTTDEYKAALLEFCRGIKATHDKIERAMMHTRRKGVKPCN